jgi:hypothetical protein
VVGQDSFPRVMADHYLSGNSGYLPGEMSDSSSPGSMSVEEEADADIEILESDTPWVGSLADATTTTTTTTTPSQVGDIAGGDSSNGIAAIDASTAAPLAAAAPKEVAERSQAPQHQLFLVAETSSTPERE